MTRPRPALRRPVTRSLKLCRSVHPDIPVCAGRDAGRVTASWHIYAGQSCCLSRRRGPVATLRRVRMELRRVVGLALWAIALSTLPLTSCGTTPPVTPQGTTPTPTPPPPPPQPPSGTWIGDGSYTVGVDISAGRWHTDGPRTERASDAVDDVVGTSKCAWRLGWFDVKFGVPKMIPIARSDDSGPADVDLGPDGATFETHGCKVWWRR